MKVSTQVLRVSLVGVFCATVLFVPSILLAAENLIANPSVETGGRTLPYDWSREKRGNNVSIFRYANEGSTGTRSVGIEVVSYVTGYSGWFFDPVAAAGNTSYTYTLDYKATVESDIVARFFSSQTTYVDVVVDTIAPQTDWTAHEVEFVTPAKTTSLTLLQRTKSLGEVTADNFSLTKGTASSTPPAALQIESMLPDDGAVLVGQAEVNVLVSGVVEAVVFRVGETELGEVTASPYQLSFDTTQFADGDYELTVVAVGSVGSTTETKHISIKNTATPPTEPPVDPPEPPSEPPAGDNLIANPSVETGGHSLPDDWSREKRGNNVSIFRYINEGSAGTRSVGIEVVSYVTGYSGWFFDPVAVSGGDQYTYSAYYQADVPTELVLRSFDDLGNHTDTVVSSIPAAADWTQFQTTFDVPATAVSLTLTQRISTTGSVRADNFMLQLTGKGTSTPPATLNLVPNSSVEIVSVADSTLPQSWHRQKFGVNNAQFTYLNEGNSGARALKVEITDHASGTAYYEFDSVPIVPGETYEYSVRYKADVYAEVDAAFTLADGSVEYQYLGVSYPSEFSWSTFTTRVVAPADAVSVTLYNMLYSAGFLITDDYSLTQEEILPLAKPIVTLTFDDAFVNFYDNALPLFQKYDMAGTMYLVSQDFADPAYMTPAQLLELEEYGFEMGSHTVTHPHLPLLSTVEVQFELEESKQVIEEKLGHPIDAFATPFGEYNDAVLVEIMKVYDSHRSVDVGYNSADNFTKSNIKAMSAVVDTSPETVLGWVDTAIANQAWLSIVYHDIVDGGGQFTNTPAHLEAVLAGLEARGVAVMTNKQALLYIESTFE